MIRLPGMDELWCVLPEARMVGGAVRDMLAGLPVADVDFASPLAPQEVMARARKAGLKAVPTGLAYGTVTVVTSGRAFEVTTLRRDVETDGRHAVVEFTDDWEMDASRRDFTINAMSATQDGRVFDYFSGRKDLAEGRVRFVGDAISRVAEDYLRIFRFFRFFARYGRGAPDGEAIAAIRALREGIKTLSAERVWSELKRILQAPDPMPAVVLMEETGVLPLVVPGADVERLGALVKRGAPVDCLLRMAALLPGDPAGFAKAWRLSGAEQERLEAIRVPNGLGPEDDDAALRRALAADTAETLIARLWLGQDSRLGWDRLRERLAVMERPVFPLKGRDITKLGVAAGPEVGEILQSVQDWWLQGGCVAGEAACRARARELLAR